VFFLFWNVASARDEISLRQRSAQFRTLEGALVAKNVRCWQQCFFFTHAFLHIVYTRPQTSGSRAACGPRRCFVRPTRLFGDFQI